MCPKCFHKYIEDPKREVKPFSLQRGEAALCKGRGSHTELDRKMSELICFSCERLEEVESEGPQFEVIKPKKNTFYNHKKIKEFFGPNIIFHPTITKQVNIVLNSLHDFDPTEKVKIRVPFTKNI